MEVTNNNSNPFTLKLGAASPQTFASDVFSTHLRESQPDLRPRKDEREAPADRNTAQSEKAEKAEAAEERRAARSRDRDRDRDEENYDTTERDTGKEQVTGTSGEGITLTDNTNTPPANTDEKTLTSHETVEGNLEEHDPDGLNTTEQISTLTTDSEETTGAQTNQTQTRTTVDGNTFTSPEQDAATPTTEVNSTLDTLTEVPETLIAGQPRPADIATAQTAATSNPTANLASQTVQTGTQNAPQQAASTPDSTDKPTSLQSPQGESLEGDADADGNGEKSLGQQAIDSLANRNKPATASLAAPFITMQATSTTTPTVPVPALVSLGLNASSLSANVDLDLLGLNANGQIAGSGTPQNANPLLVRFGALPGQAQATQVPNAAIALQIAKHVAKGISTFEIRLDPPEMGRIDIKLELGQSGRVTAHLMIEKSDTLDLMQRDSKALEQALRDAGLDVNSDTLNFSLQKGENEEADALEQNADGSNADTDDEAAQQANIVTALAARQLEAAARGGIDVSI